MGDDSDRGDLCAPPTDVHEGNKWLDNVQVPPPLQVSWSAATTTTGLQHSRVAGTQGAHRPQPRISLGRMLPASTLATCSPEVARTSNLCISLGRMLPASTLVTCSPEVALTSNLCAVRESIACSKDPR